MEVGQRKREGKAQPLWMLSVSHSVWSGRRESQVQQSVTPIKNAAKHSMGYVDVHILLAQAPRPLGKLCKQTPLLNQT